MSGPNDRELQGLVNQALGVPSCTLQIQRAGADLVFRIRYPLRLNDPKRGPMLTTEYRMTKGILATRQEVTHELPAIVELSLVMAFTEVIRRDMDWPGGWPVPTPQQIERVLTAPTKQDTGSRMTNEGRLN
jgi:hypothetical protein